MKMQREARAAGDGRGRAASQALQAASVIYGGDDEDYCGVLHRGEVAEGSTVFRMS